MLAFRDGDFSDIEKIFIYRYILKCPELSADTKVALALELDEPPPTTISNILDKVRSLISFKDLFASEEEAIGFIWVMYNLANADNSFDKEEAIYIKKVCSDCKIPLNLMPKEILTLPNPT